MRRERDEIRRHNEQFAVRYWGLTAKEIELVLLGIFIACFVLALLGLWPQGDGSCSDAAPLVLRGC